MDETTLARRRHEVQIVDVRWPNEWDAGHIEGAVHIPAPDLEERLDELDRSRPMVTVCRSGNRSTAAAGVLTGEGFRAESLDGGMVAWENAGLPVVDSEGGPGRVAEPEPPADDRAEGHQRLQADYVRLALEVQEHFGDRKPSEAEVRDYLRDRLISEGHSPDEADNAMARVTGGQD